MEKLSKNQNERYKKIEIKPFVIKPVWATKKADLILTKKKDMCDFLALGFYCLRLSLQESEISEIRVKYSSNYFKGSSGVAVINDHKERDIRRNALEEVLEYSILPVLEYVYNGDEFKKSMIRMMGMMLYPELTACVDNLYSAKHARSTFGISAMELLRTFEMDPAKAQERAYEVACKNLDRMFL